MKDQIDYILADLDLAGLIYVQQFGPVAMMVVTDKIYIVAEGAMQKIQPVVEKEFAQLPAEFQDLPRLYVTLKDAGAVIMTGGKYHGFHDSMAFAIPFRRYTKNRGVVGLLAGRKVTPDYKAIDNLIERAHKYATQKEKTL